MTLEQEENAGMLISEKYDHLISSNDLECPIHFPMKRLHCMCYDPYIPPVD